MRIGLVRCRAIHPWLGLFLLVTAVFPLEGGTNAASRYAAMCALSEDRTAKIDPIYHWTLDWSRTPVGHYYSNKAPGPMLLSWPLFHVMDTVATWGLKAKADRYARRFTIMTTQLRILSWLVQALPWAVVVAWSIAWLDEQGASQPALHFAALSMLFGNTASLLMNTFFGHGMVAVFSLALGLSIVRRQTFFWSGLLFGCALLCDYASALFLPGLLVVMGLQAGGVRTWARKLVPFIAGGILPAGLWCAYHIHAFGGPLTLASRYLNPRFVYVGTLDDGLAGQFHAFPQPEILIELLFGPRRGILVTQPWIFVLVIALLIFAMRGAYRRSRVLFLLGGYATSSLVLLLLMNGAFGGWHGGHTPGPRYLSGSLPLFGLVGALMYDRLPAWTRAVLCATLAVSLVLAMLVYSTTLLVPETENLWLWYGSAIGLDFGLNATQRLILLILLASAAAATVMLSRQERARVDRQSGDGSAC